MHDLNTINRLNREAFGASVNSYRTKGLWVLAKYDGLHLVSVETFRTEQEAVSGHERAVAGQAAAEHFKLLAPHHAAGAEVAQATAPRKDVTLADYITRKTADNTTHGY